MRRGPPSARCLSPPNDGHTTHAARSHTLSHTHTHTGWNTALLTATDGQPSTAADRAAPVDWRSLLRSGELERLGVDPALLVAADDVAGLPPGGGGRRPAPKRSRGGAAAAAPVPPPLATAIIGATVGVPGPGSTTGSDPDALADLERAADRAKAIQTKNRENQRRHRERQRSKLAAAEERVADLETELGASQRARSFSTSARVVAAERGGAPRSALASLSSSHARLRAALRGIPHADALKSVESMHLSELVQDRRMLCEAVAALVDDPAHTDPSSPAGQRLGTLLSARHDTVRGFFHSALKPMHMMFAAYERHDNAR